MIKSDEFPGSDVVGKAIPGVASIDVHVFARSGLVAGVCHVVVRFGDLTRLFKLRIFHERETSSSLCNDVAVVPSGGPYGLFPPVISRVRVAIFIDQDIFERALWRTHGDAVCVVVSLFSDV